MPVCPAGPVCGCARELPPPARYLSGTTGGDWALLAPLLPVPACQTATGSRRSAAAGRRAIPPRRSRPHRPAQLERDRADHQGPSGEGAGPERLVKHGRRRSRRRPAA